MKNVKNKKTKSERNQRKQENIYGKSNGIRWNLLCVVLTYLIES